jgi:mannan endo-1,4-beta-mannosidase
MKKLTFLLGILLLTACGEDSDKKKNEPAPVVTPSEEPNPEPQPEPEVPAVEIKISETAINTSNAGVEKIYKLLYDNYGKKIVSGSMANVSVEQNEAALVKAATGKTPVMQTIDFIHLQYSWGRDSYADISKFKEHWEKGGIISASWHMMCPVSESGVNDESSWKYEGPFDAAAATTSGTWQNRFLDKMLSDCANSLKLFKEAGIPVIWRPLHEASGHNGNYGKYGWFWWGQSGAEAYKKLWIYMFDFFKKEGLDNLIWVWTSQSGGDTPEDSNWYPGSEYADIIACDLYNKTEAQCIKYFETLSVLFPDKMIALGENGGIAEISGIFSKGGKFSYFMPWYTYNLTDLKKSEHANLSWWKDAAECQEVLFLEDIK